MLVRDTAAALRDVCRACSGVPRATRGRRGRRLTLTPDRGGRRGPADPHPGAGATLGRCADFLAPAASHLARGSSSTPRPGPYGIPATLAAIVAFFVIALGLMILVGHLRDRHRRR